MRSNQSVQGIEKYRFSTEETHRFKGDFCELL